MEIYLYYNVTDSVFFLFSSSCIVMLGDSELSYIFSLCDVGQKGYITSSDIRSVGSEYGPELGTILSILRLGKGTD
ncbi:Uncharacterized protein FKW44_016568 [Caligus rogercresseyi]|uniref:Uncharacterized protein n=1 Tax=Caligus rogercresseyi TaxID=217165 RepID=A0A7T8H233_CALRO|nr:Uncharacterized protein FKW44_016568 [Caligus rogercresseyi]